MITVNVARLVDAIKEADVFSLPDLNEGTEYLYNGIYKRLTQGEDVRLSGLDFDAFEPDDIDRFNNLYTDVIEKNDYVAGGIMSTLRQAAPMSRAVGFV